MYCFDGAEFTPEGNQEMELFSPIETINEKELFEQTSDAETKMNFLYENSLPDLADLLSETPESQNLAEFLQLLKTEESPSTSPAISSWNTLFSYPDNKSVESDYTDCTDYELESNDVDDDDDGGSNGTLGFTDEELLSMAAKDVNRLKGFSKDDILLIKKRRRVLLNRCYARKSRAKRLDAQSNSNQEKEMLLKHLEEVKEELKATRRDRDKYKDKYNALKEVIDSAISEKIAKNTPM